MPISFQVLENVGEMRKFRVLGGVDGAVGRDGLCDAGVAAGGRVRHGLFFYLFNKEEPCSNLAQHYYFAYHQPLQ